MNTEQTTWTLHTGLKHAGSFFQALCAAGLKADPVNRRRLLEAFPEIEAQYGPASRLYLGHRLDSTTIPAPVTE